ncbi:MAG: glycoside-pentoside-hexuronide (GPH):cation symporter [Clostridiales bacterium]|jgi:probable glucitol transport protein GutA|nr:glycoside-pentoside-hexuronide (GPH):cation symporter [Clostridiales bacterium]
MTKNTAGKPGYRTSKSERAGYWLFFLGQNIFYGLVAINMQTFFSDVGITAASIAVILLVTKLWDAVNDPLLGAVIDKIRFKKGRFIPWLRISLPAIVLSSIVFFLLPSSGSPILKIIWATLAYIAWDMSYTLCDVPIFVLPTSMTDNIEERGQMLTMGRFFAMIGVIAASVALPALQARIGWFAVGLVFTAAAALVMLPLLFRAKERQIVRPEESVSIRQMIKYVTKNKYLLIFYLAMFISGLMYFSQYIQIYLARYCIGNQDAASVISMISMIPLLIVGGFLPAIIKRIDKYHLYIVCNIAAAIFGVVLFFVGYSNVTLLYVLFFLQAIFTGANNIILFTFTPDCLEYGTYHTGERAEGVAASVQTFFSKLVGSVSGPIAMVILAGFGFVSGENAAQPPEIANVIWLLYTLPPACGIGIALILLRFYKLRDKDVQVMARYNNGEITKEAAENQLAAKYGPAAELVKMTVTLN